MQTNRYCNQKNSRTCGACMNVKCDSNINPVVNMLNRSIECLSDLYDKSNDKSHNVESILDEYLRMS